MKRRAPPPGLLSGLDAAHAPLRRIIARARRLGLNLVLLQLRLTAAPDAPGGRAGWEPFLPHLAAELRGTDLAWRGPRPDEWLILLEAAADASAAVLRWQAAARQWGLQLCTRQVEFPGGGLTLAELFAALQPAVLTTNPAEIGAAGEGSDGG
ncbi:MAG: hypothetical protein ACRD13_11460 [Terriglobales bacterium]